MKKRLDKLAVLVYTYTMIRKTNITRKGGKMDRGQECMNVLIDFFIAMSDTGIEVDTSTGQYYFAWNTVAKDRREHNLLG